MPIKRKKQSKLEQHTTSNTPPSTFFSTVTAPPYPPQEFPLVFYTSQALPCALHTHKVMSIPWRKQRNTVLFPHRCIPNPTPSALAQHHLVFISVSPIEPSQPQEIPPTTSYCIVLRQTPPNTSNTAFLPRSRRMHFLQKSPKPVSFVFFALIFKHVTNKRMEEYFYITDGIEF